VLLIRRQRPPYKGRWALPGGFVEMGESLEESVRREIKEETGIRRVTRLRQIGAYGDPGRDPRGRTVTVAYLGVVSGTGAAAKGGDDAAEAQWYPISSLPKDLAFDHALILRDGLRLFHRNLRLCRRDYA
jgi:8-oxo-dGTP diphosphatase